MSEKRTKLGRFVHNAWTNMNIRASNGRYHHLQRGVTLGKNVTYQDITIDFERTAFKEWCEGHRTIIETLQRPSIDRRETSKGYTLSNLQIIELRDNIRKDKTVFVDGHAVCCRCQQSKPEDQFTRDRRRSNGRTSICLLCDRERCQNKYRRLYATGR